MAKKKNKKKKEKKVKLGKSKETAREKMIGQHIGYRYDVNMLPDYKKITPFLKKYIEHMGWDDLNWLEDVHMGYEEDKPAVFDRNANGWVTIPKKIKLPNNTFVHRDFHVSNLMINRNNFGVIDSQDALFGNKAYDLASLIDDVRLKTSNELKNLVYKYYFSLNKNKFDKIFFKNDFEILSVLRNLKIIGIFARLAIRDKKRKYLKLIPYAWNLIEFRLKNNFIFNDLKNFLDINFSKKIRIKK